MVCHGDVAFEMVEKSVTKDSLGSDANLAWNSLQCRFDPKMSSNKLKLKKKFTNSSSTNLKKDPIYCIMILEKIRTQLYGMGNVISDKDFMINLLDNLPEEYKSKVESLENDLDSKDDPMTLNCMLVE